MTQSLKFLLFGLTALALMLSGVFFLRPQSQLKFLNPLSQTPFTPTAAALPLQSYAFMALSAYNPPPGNLILAKPLLDTPDFSAYLFQVKTQGKTMTGQINLPKTATPSAGFPVILMLRGYVEPAIYQTGMGTKNAAAAFAREGFVTLAPDFLGYGESDPPASNVIAERLEKPKNLLDLMAALPSLPFINPKQVFIWAHSNGGQIALSLLEITGRSLPTSLWAPVSKPFPYSILYYSDSAPDQGKALRQELAHFEAQYDVYDFSIDRYLDRIQAPLQIHQGTADDAVPLSWSQSLVSDLEDLDKPVNLFIYPNADHNLKPGWDTAIARDLDFYKSYTTK